MTINNRLKVALALVLSIGGFCADAHAGDPATATMLFNDGKRLATAGSYADACPKFEESQRLDPAIGTQFNLADCYEHLGKTASAWAMFQDVASSARSAGQAARAQVAAQRAAAIEAKVSKLTIVAPKNATGLEVRRNGELLGSVLWGNAAPVDPGSYTIEATAPGKQRWSSVAAVGPNGASVTVTIPPLEDAATPAAEAADPVPSGASPATGAEAAVPHADEPSRASPLRTAGLVVGAGGIVGLGVGAVFGILSISKHADYSSHCAGNVCDPQGLSGHADAVTYGNVSTGAFIAGGVLVAAGGVLFLTAPKTHTATGLYLAPSLGRGEAGITIGGGWM